MTKTKFWLSLLAISVVLVAGSLAVSPIAVADEDDEDDDDDEENIFGIITQKLDEILVAIEAGLSSETETQIDNIESEVTNIEGKLDGTVSSLVTDIKTETEKIQMVKDDVGMVKTTVGGIDTEVTNIEAKLDDGTSGLGALKSILDQIVALLTGIDTETDKIQMVKDDVGMIKTDVGAIKTETDKIQMVKDDIGMIKTKTGTIFTDSDLFTGTGATASVELFRNIPEVSGGKTFVISATVICKFNFANIQNEATIKLFDGTNTIPLVSVSNKLSDTIIIATTGVITWFDTTKDYVPGCKAAGGSGATTVVVNELRTFAVGWTD